MSLKDKAPQKPVEKSSEGKADQAIPSKRRININTFETVYADENGKKAKDYELERQKTAKETT